MAKKSARKAAQQQAADRPTRKARGKKFEGGELHKSVWHKGKNYGPGDEEAFSKANVSKESLQMLANKGVLTGFDTEEPPEEPEEETPEE